jgi:predicted PurR-regulated permease PerM
MQSTLQNNSTSLSLWLKRLIISLTLLIWVVLGAILFWAVGYVRSTLVLLAIAALLAYALYPAVKLLQRVMPRPVAVVLVYLVALSGLSAMLYLLARTTIDQVISLTHYVQSLLNAGGNNQLTPFLETLNRLGFSQEQLRATGQQLVAQLQSLVRSVLPLLSSLLNFLLNTLVVATLSIYLLLDGSRVTTWLRQNTPRAQREPINASLDTLQRVIGGYIRGQLLLATTISLLTGLGMALLGVPYAVFLAVVAFLLEFIPIVGAVLTGVVCVAVALTQGWVTALLVLGFVVFLQALEGQILAPRILGGSVGLHPIVALLALLAGSELFGITGALFASPMAGVLQALLVGLWSQWRERHPEQFQHEEKPEETLHMPHDGIVQRVDKM